MTGTVREIRFSSVGNHFSLRSDAKYRLFWGINGGELYPGSELPTHSLRWAILPLRAKKMKKGSLPTEFQLIELEDVEKRTGVILSTTTVDRIESDKLLFGSADLLTTRLRPNLGKTISNVVGEPLIGSTEWIPIKVNRERLDPLLLKYYLLSSRYVDHAERLLSGKEHPRIAESDILSLRIPFPSKCVQEKLVRNIVDRQNDIESLRKTIRQPPEIINEIICDEFDYPIREQIDRDRETTYTRLISALTNSFTLRNSTRFHHPHFEVLERFFARTSHEALKSHIESPIRLGATAQKGDFIEDGEAYYVHAGAIKHEKVIDLADCYRVSSEFFDRNRRFRLRVGDVVLNRAGEGTIGKSGLFDSDEPAIFSDFTMRLRFDRTMNSRFAWYYLRSIIFQTQVEREKRGMGNMTNIFPSQVERMLMPKCKRDRQDTIVDQIDAELNKLALATTSIERKHREIEEVIAHTVERS